MPRYRFSSQLPTDISKNGTLDPNNIKKPVIENTPDNKPENFVTKPEKTVKPLTTIPDHKYSPFGNQTYGSPRRSYGVTDEKRDKPSTLVRDSGYNSSITKVDETKSYNYLDDKRGKTTNPVQERPKQVDDFITNIQTETNRATRPGPLIRRNWRGTGGANGHGEYTTYSNNDLDKPIIDGVRYEPVVEPYVVGKNGWEGPSKREWAIPPTQVTPIFGPTNDTGEAVYILKEAVKSAPPPRYNSNIRDTNMGNVDSREAQRGYGNPNLVGSPVPRYITSTEAARKYGGIAL